MNKALKLKMLVLTGLMFLLPSCSTVPITGRRQFNLVPDSMVNAMALQEYSNFIAQSKLSGNAQQTQTVKQVGGRISQAVEKFNAENNIEQKYDWEFNLVEDDAVNAWAMPGGKVVIYTGILPLTQDETGLAVVVGHEIAHAWARHGSERMSQGLMVQMGGIALSEALSKYPAQTQNLFMQAFEVGSQVGVLLPYSRRHEEEADHLGLIFMALAGYDPQAAVDFWQRMAAAKEAPAPPEFLSTHPSDETRIKKIKERIPEALKYYRQNVGSPGGPL